MPLPQATSVAQLFKEHPECWTKGTTFRDENDNEVTRAAEASKCCLYGACIYVYNEEGNPTPKSVAKVYGIVNEPIGNVNDAPETTIEDIIRIAEKAGV